MDHTEESMQQQVDYFISKMAARRLKATFALVTMGSQTDRGGEVVTASTSMVCDGWRIACVGDVVRYPDGTESLINSGAGSAFVFKGCPFAIVGSTTDNGDTIISSLQEHARVREYADEPIPGLLQPGYIGKWVEPA